jgi:hypothetical protein
MCRSGMVVEDKKVDAEADDASEPEDMSRAS